MSLQELFYLVAIIFMIISAIVVMSIGITFFLLYRQVGRIQQSIAQKISLIAHPAELMLGAGALVAEKTVRKVQGLLNSNKKPQNK